MTTEIKYVPLGGGVNMIDSHVTMPDGMLTECMNWEQVFGQQGYTRIPGFERYDGHLDPHKATYWLQEFDTGTSEIFAGDIVTGVISTADVLLVELATGTWAGGDAAGRLILGNLTGTWADNDAISVGTPKALASAATDQGSVSETLNTTYKALAIEDRRAAISAVPGSGPILGLGIANSIAYAARNVANGTSATLYKASASGWTSVKTGLFPGGRYRMRQANFSGSTKSLYLFGCDGKNRSWKFDGTTFTFMAPIYGSQATSATSIAIGTGAKAFTCTETLRSFATGQEFYVWSTANAANWMKGTFTTYAANVLTINVTATGGSGTFTDWEIGLSSFADKPFEMVDHRDHMFLAYPYGQLQTSDLGDPMTYASTAALFGISDEITGLVPMRAGTLAVYALNRTMILSGSSKTTWSMSANSLSSGAVRFSAQEIASNALALDDRGLTSLQATLNYGGFEMSVFSRYIQPYVEKAKPLVIDSGVVRAKNQYRLYLSTGEVITCTVLSPNAQITPKDVAFTRSDYEIGLSCATSGEILGEEYQLLGTTDGFVVRENVGASFDGKSINSVLRLPFTSLKLPANKKRFRKLVIEIDTPQLTTLHFKELFDYADGYYAAGSNDYTQAFGGGGQWNTSEWDTFQWSLPIQTQAEANISGVGRNMSLLIWHESALDESFNLQGILIHYSVLGMTR